MTCSIPKAHRRSPDIITYRCNGKMVYVPVASDYIALGYARQAFPQLKKLRNASFTLFLTVPEHNGIVGISESVWPMLVAHMSRYQVIDIHVQPDVVIPDITITYADAEDHGCMGVVESVPPPYCGSDSVDESEKVPFPGTRTLSASTSHSRKRNWFLQKFHASSL